MREEHSKTYLFVTRLATAAVLVLATSPSWARKVAATQEAVGDAEANAQTQPAAKADDGLAWLTRFADALDESRRTRNPIVVEVGADWCVWCRQLNQEIAKPEIQQRLRGVTRLRLDADRDADAIHNLAVGPLPALRVLSASGQMLAWHNGYMKADELSAWLDAHAKPAAAPIAELEGSGAPDAAAVDKIIEQLTDRDPLVHEAAVKRLMDYPDVGAKPIVTLFATGKLAQRVAAREVLEAWKAPVQGLDPWNPTSITPASLEALQHWATQKHEPPSMAALSPGDLEIVRHDIAAMLQTTDSAEVESARERLARFGPALLPEIYAAIKSAGIDRDRERLTALRYRAVATQALALHWPGGFDRLAATDVQTRHAALDELGGQITPNDSPLLMELFSDPDPFMRETSLKLLESIGGTMPGGFVRLLHDPEPNVRAAVLKQLAETPDERMVGEVVKYVSAEKDPDLIVHAIRFLRQTQSNAAISCLQSLAGHESWRVRAEAAEGMGGTLQRNRFGPSDLKAETQADIYAAMIKLLDDPDGFVVSRALAVLKGAQVPAATKAIAKLADRRPEMAADVIKVLGAQTNDASAQQTLRKFITNKDAAVRTAALTALGQTATTEDLLPALADSSSQMRVAAATIVEELLEQQRPGNNRTSFGRNETVDWDQWLSDYRAAKGRASWTMRVIDPLKKMLQSIDANEQLVAALPLVALGDDGDALKLLHDRASSSPKDRQWIARALQWLPWDARVNLFNVLKSASASDPRALGALAEHMAASPNGKAPAVLWELLETPSADLSVASAVSRALVDSCPGLNYWNFRADSATTPEAKALLESCKKKAAEGNANQRLVALSLLLSATPEDAAAAAQPVVSNVAGGDGLRTAALQVLLMSQGRNDGVKTAIANLDGPEPLRHVALAYLAAGAEPIRSIQGEIFLNYQNQEIEFRTLSEGVPVVITPPPGLTTQMLQPMLKDSNAEVAAYAGYLLCIQSDRTGLDSLIAQWQKSRDDATWRRLAYRGISVIGDDELTPTLEQVYASYDKQNPRDISDFYWTIRVMKGPKILKLRKRIRDEIGMDQLR